MNTKIIIFDLDGTLIDSRQDLAAGVNHMRTHYGLSPLSLEIASSYIGDGVRKLVERSDRPIVVDADGLNAFAGKPELLAGGAKRPRILTPHPGEMARLIGRRPSDV